jgi:hypothetical protein
MNERSIFMEALEKDTQARRSAYLREACGGDVAQRPPCQECPADPNPLTERTSYETARLHDPDSRSVTDPGCHRRGRRRPPTGATRDAASPGDATLDAASATQSGAAARRVAKGRAAETRPEGNAAPVRFPSAGSSDATDGSGKNSCWSQRNPRQDGGRSHGPSWRPRPCWSVRRG